MMSMFSDLFELDELRRKTEEAWRQECNAKGLEIFYDMSNPTKASHDHDEDCSDDCDEYILLGHYSTRPCKKPFHGCKGHVCNPGQARITGLSVAGLNQSSSA